MSDNTAELIAERKKLMEKLKVERGLREDLKQRVAALEEENAVLKRRRIAAIKGGSAASADAAFDNLVKVANTNLDSDEVKAKIAAYHATLDKKGYDHVWRERLDAILAVLATGEAKLSRAVATVRRAEERKRKMGLDTRRWVINDAYMELPWRPAASAYRSAVFEAVMDQIKPDTTKVIETGSGWGEHLCNIFLEGGPLEATYYALELEEEGRKCALLLAALDPDLKMEAHFFDYQSADYAALPKDDAHTLLLTAHSIEQVAQIDPKCILSALELGARVTGVHVEPVGWQLSTESEWSEASREHHERCTKLRYNRNLWTLLKDFEAANRIRILDVRQNFIGLDYNPASLIVWEKVV